MTDQKPKKLTEAQALQLRVDKLEKALCKVATLAGQGNQLREFGLEPWIPSKADMKKNRG